MVGDLRLSPAVTDMGTEIEAAPVENLDGRSPNAWTFDLGPLLEFNGFLRRRLVVDPVSSTCPIGNTLPPTA